MGDFTDPPEIWFQPWCDACEADRIWDGEREMDRVNSWPNGCERASECGKPAVKYILIRGV